MAELWSKYAPLSEGSVWGGHTTGDVGCAAKNLNVIPGQVETDQRQDHRSHYEKIPHAKQLVH